MSPRSKDSGVRYERGDHRPNAGLELMSDSELVDGKKSLKRSKYGLLSILR